MTRADELEGLVAELREEALARHSTAWSRMDGGQEYTLSAMLADRAADALASLKAEVEELRDRVDELEGSAEVISAEFEKDCWKAMRALLDECHFDWGGVEPSEGVTADAAREYISETLSDIEANWEREKARADTLAAAIRAKGGGDAT